MADPALVMVVVAVERGAAASLPLTLVIGGSLIAGTLISAAAYRDQLTQGYASVLSTEASEADLRQLFGQIFTVAGQHERRVGDWLHLTDCVLISHGQVVQFGGGAALLRVQTAAVAGWVLGRPA